MSASYTRFSDDIELPPAEIMQRDTFVFKGWNETEDGVFYIGCDSTAKSEENIAW